MYGYSWSDPAEEEEMDREYLEELRKAAMRNIPIEVVLLVGKTVAEPGKLAASYNGACELRYFRSFSYLFHFRTFSFLFCFRNFGFICILYGTVPGFFNRGRIVFFWPSARLRM